VRAGILTLSAFFGLWNHGLHDYVRIRKALRCCQPDARRSLWRSSPRFPSLLLQCRQCRTRERDWLPDAQLGLFFGVRGFRRRKHNLALYYCWAVFTIFKRWFFIDMDRLSIFSTSSNYVVWTGMGLIFLMVLICFCTNTKICRRLRLTRRERELKGTFESVTRRERERSGCLIRNYP
jgi:hypothetical protein